MILSYVAAYDGGQSNTANNESYDTKSDKQASLPEITSDSSVTDEQAFLQRKTTLKEHPKTAVNT